MEKLSYFNISISEMIVDGLIKLLSTLLFVRSIE